MKRSDRKNFLTPIQTLISPTLTATSKKSPPLEKANPNHDARGRFASKENPDEAGNGQCFTDAYNAVQNGGPPKDENGESIPFKTFSDQRPGKEKGPKIVHGIVNIQNPRTGEKGKGAHAWVEMGSGPMLWSPDQAGGPGKWYLKDQFYRAAGVENPTTYTPKEAMAAALKHGHYGPWKGEPQFVSSSGEKTSFPLKGEVYFDLKKIDPYHDERGRFSSSDADVKSAVSEWQQDWHDIKKKAGAIARGENLPIPDAEPSTERNARAMLDGIQNGKTFNQALWRGVHPWFGNTSKVEALANLPVGAELQISDPSSFTRNQEVGMSFLTDDYSHKPGVLLKIEPGAKGLDAESYGSSVYYNEKEVITNGRFIVVGKENPGGVPVVTLKQKSLFMTKMLLPYDPSILDIADLLDGRMVEKVAKFNPNHDAKGEFASGSSGKLNRDKVPVRTIEELSSQKPLASVSHDGYRMDIAFGVDEQLPPEDGNLLRVGTFFITKESSGEKTRGGYFMDYPDTMSNQKYFAMPLKDRALFELNQQKKYGYQGTFDFQSKLWGTSKVHKAIYKFCSTQVALPAQLTDQIIAIGEHLIGAQDLSGKGRELDPHVTVKYGVSYNPDQLQKILELVDPFTVTLGLVTGFDVSDHSEGTAPIVVNVSAPELSQLHDLVGAAIGVKPDNFAYTPHLTLAYVKPEEALKFEGDHSFVGISWLVESVQLTNTDGEVVEILLGGGLVPFMESTQKIRKADDEADADDNEADIVADQVNLAVENEWLALPANVRQALLDAFVAGADKGIVEMGLSDSRTIGEINQLAADWAANRSAELIGMKYDEEGNLVPNPDADYVISDTTRDDIKELVYDAFQGETPIEALAADIQDAGVFSDARAHLIASQEVKMAQVGGNYQAWQSSGLVQSLEWFLSADHDHDDECLAGSTMVSTGPLLRTFSRWYSGPFVEIELPGGKKLTGTPNHPVLTDVGWKILKDVKQGDNLISGASFERIPSMAKYFDEVESRLEDKVDSFRGRPVSKVTSSTEFHGDGIGSKVHVVRTNSFLNRKISYSTPKKLIKSFFSWGIKLALGLLRERSLLSGFSRSLRFFSKRSFSAEDQLAFAGSSELIARSSKPLTNSTSRYAKFVGDLKRGHIFLEVKKGKFFSGSCGETATLPAIDVVHGSGSFQVFNLTTESGFFIAENIITRNCDLNDGEVVPIGEPFPSGDLAPPAHIGCVCSVAAAEVNS